MSTRNKIEQCISTTLPSSKPIIYQCASIRLTTPYLSILRCIVVFHLNDIVYIAEMFEKLVFSRERVFFAIAPFNITLEFRLQSWILMPRPIMAIKITHTATSDWAVRHQADEAVWTWVVWDNRLVLEWRNRTLTRHVVLLECRINGSSQCGCIGES